MPIEVRELVIKARIEDLPTGDSSGASGKGGSGSPASITEAELQAIIETCTEEVLKIIERKKQR